MNEFKKECLLIIMDTLVNKGEYDFEDGSEAVKFAKDVLSQAEEEYSLEGYFHEYEDFKDFLYTHHVDTMAYHIYTEMTS